MKSITLLSFLVLLTSLSFGQTKNAENYIISQEELSSGKFFKMVGDHSYMDFYLPEKVKFGDNEYHARVRLYSWLSADTAYFRENENSYLHFDSKTNRESVVLPKEVEVGQKWFEADSSWSYEIIGIDEVLETPEKTYRGLIVIECLQVTGRDKHKSAKYHLHYAKGIGLVGSITNGRLNSYLSEVVKDPEKGDMIGN